MPRFREVNGLTPVGCQPTDDEHSRACAFDSYLVTHGPVTVTSDIPTAVEPAFVRLGDAYYRRIHRQNRSANNQTVIYHVKRVPARTVLETVALNLSDYGTPVSDDLRVQLRVALTGETTASFEELEATELGRVYRLNGSYYTVVRTDRQTIDHGVGFLRYDVPRYLLAGVGLVLLVGALFRRLRDR